VTYGQIIETQPGINDAVTQVNDDDLLEQIQKEVEDYIGMELKLCIKDKLANGYDLLFTPLEAPEDMNDIRFFEAIYIDGESTEINELFLEEPVYQESQNEESLSASITMTTGISTFIVIRKHTSNKPGVGRVTARGLFLAQFGKMRFAGDFSYEKHYWPYWRASWTHDSHIPSDRSYGEVYAEASYLSFAGVVKIVGAKVRQYADSYFNWERNDWTWP
jgi:hypothetical protein